MISDMRSTETFPTKTTIIQSQRDKWEIKETRSVIQRRYRKQPIKSQHDTHLSCEITIGSAPAVIYNN